MKGEKTSKSKLVWPRTKTDIESYIKELKQRLKDAEPLTHWSQAQIQEYNHRLDCLDYWQHRLQLISSDRNQLRGDYP